ncbi:MAG TPA: glucose 1-dehydrogenase [Thermoanaerobaculia bacterium]|jgi:3-oxoacyl-[acyl-carrier protein] reductase
MTALVTGAGGGIGRATALCLGEMGMDIAVHYFRNADGAKSIVAELEKMGRKAEAFQADLSRADEARNIVCAVEKRLGSVDVLINNAGDLVERRPLLEMTEELWRRILDLNLTSAFFCTQAAAQGMVARGRGVIVNVSSLAAHNGGGPGAFAYATAKGALISFTKAIAKELAPKGIRVNAVAPALIGETNFHDRYTPRDAFENTIRSIPLGRAGTPEDVARVIKFLVSDDSAYLVGETIDITGGLHVR